MHRALLPSSVAFCLTGCSLFGVGNVTEDNWSETYAEVYCKQLETCNLGLFESEYSDMADCMDEVGDALDDVDDAANDADCDFDEEEAQQCVDAIHESDCEDFYEGDYLSDCEDVYDCDGGSFSNPGDTGFRRGGDTAYGSDGTSGGADGGSTSGGSVTGLHGTEILDSGAVARWAVNGTWDLDCSDCVFQFTGDFTLLSDSDFGVDFSSTVTWTSDYYVYSNGDYWGYGAGDGGGYAYWYGYSGSAAYYYAGYVLY